MITALDHIVLICRDIEQGILAYEQVLGASPHWCNINEEEGTASAEFRVENTALELTAPHGEGPVGDRLRELLADGGEGLASLVFAVDDIAHAQHLLTRRGLNPSEILEGHAKNDINDSARRWFRFRCDDSESGGVRLFVLQRDAREELESHLPDDAAYALDHLVIGTSNPNRAAALYGARLGIHLALDRTAEQWNTRFLFFRVGGLTLEVVTRLDDPGEPESSDRFMGLTWRVRDIEATHTRLSTKGLDVSEIRVGRKPGTRVFTLRDGTLGVPTLFLEQELR